MTQPSATEQYLLELINAERAKVGAQPLAFDGDLNEAAEGHSAWMIATDTFYAYSIWWRFHRPAHVRRGL